MISSKLSTTHKVTRYFWICLQFLFIFTMWLCTKCFDLICTKVSGILMSSRNMCGNSLLFLFFPVTVAGNSWKNQMSGNFVFSELERVGRKQGYPSRPRRGRDGVYPCLRPPPFQRENTKLREFGFFNCFSQRDW